MKTSIFLFISIFSFIFFQQISCIDLIRRRPTLSSPITTTPTTTINPLDELIRVDLNFPIPSPQNTGIINKGIDAPLLIQNNNRNNNNNNIATNNNNNNAISNSNSKNRTIENISFLSTRDKIQSSEEICSEGYDCVPYYQCKNNVILKDGSGVINIRMGADDGCFGSLETCCAINNVTAYSLPSKPLTASEGCGFRNINGVSVRITDNYDNETQFGEFPWMTAVLQKERTPEGSEMSIYLCGGSLINPNVVMTAAHCISRLPSNILKIRTGEWDTKSFLEPLPYQDRDVAQVVIHQNFSKSALHNDIALLFLMTPVDLTANVNTICLPPQDTLFNYQRCYATGWGKNKWGKEGKHPIILKKIQLPVIPDTECQEFLRSTRLGKYFILDESFICAGGEEGADTCRGDGGSPLVCPIMSDPNYYYQAGIVSWGIGCGTTNIPGVYVEVSKFRKWIDEMISTKGLSQSDYIPRRQLL